MKTENKINFAADNHDTALGHTEGQPVTAVLRYGGRSANINSSAFNKLCAGRQFTVPNPPQRKAANR